MNKTLLYSALLVFGATLTNFTTSSHATAISGVDASYGVATHSTTKWQELNDVNNTYDDYGVSWSVDGGDFGRDDFIIGKTVEFKINMHKNNKGNHYADFMKLWVDLDNSGKFEDSDAVLFNLKPTSEEITDFFFISDAITIEDLGFSELAIRARVTCSESLGSRWPGSKPDSWYDGEFKSTGKLYQGEVEEWTVDVAPVPEPATMFLFGTGLVGLVGFSRRKKK